MCGQSLCKSASKNTSASPTGVLTLLPKSVCPRAGGNEHLWEVVLLGIRCEHICECWHESVCVPVCYVHMFAPVPENQPALVWELGCLLLCVSPWVCPQ